MIDHYEERSTENEEMDEPEWDEYREYLEVTDEQVKLEGKDYIALFIASLQTIFLPIIIMMIVFFAIGMIIFLFV
jgi:hypothetical protein